MLKKLPSLGVAFPGGKFSDNDCRLPIRHYGFHNSGAGAEGARPTVVEAAEGRLHNGGWRGRKHSCPNDTHPQWYLSSMLAPFLFFEVGVLHCD